MERLHLRGGGLARAARLIVAVGWVFQTLGGLAAITGAYVAGLALAGSPMAEELKHGIGRAGEALLVPVFFVTIGLSADLRTVGPVLPFAVGLLVVAVLGKVIGSGLGRLGGGLQRGPPDSSASAWWPAARWRWLLPAWASRTAPSTARSSRR